MKSTVRYISVLFLLIGITFSAKSEQGKLLDPVKWTQGIYKVNDSIYLLKFEATIEDHWHVYSHYIAEGGPVPTTITFEKKENAVTLDTIQEAGLLHEEHDPNFDMILRWYDNNVNFYQLIKSNGDKASIKGYLEFMTCDDKQCLPPEYIDFEYSLPEQAKEGNESIQTLYKAALEGTNKANAPPKKKEAEKVKSAKKSNSGGIAQKGILTIFIISFLSGFAALLTPCVFPMIPMTVSFFTKQSENKAKGIRNAIYYGVCIIIIYILLGTIVTAIFGYDALNAASTNVWVNLFFFAILMIFGISFLGAFEIVLPSSWISSADQQSEKGGIIGIFFMALVLALVSFSCTGPIVGTLLVESATYGGLAPLVGMFGFSLALALPFGFFAAFPGYLNSLPKSGGWLNTVKVFLGFIEIAFAFKFLSNADLVLQYHWLEREVFLSIWIGVFIALTLYLFGFFQLPHDSKLEKLSVGRVLLGTLSLIFVIYLIPGIWGAPLKLISGFPPPMAYSESPHGVGGGATGSASIEHGPEGTHLGPQNLWAFDELEKGLEYAKKVNKPAFIDFTGHACVNCRKMEENVWGEPHVIDILRDEVVVISLYVDDKRALPEKEQKEVTLENGKKKLLRTIGNKWSYIQAEQYKTNTQPYYVMLKPDGAQLNNGSADYEHHGNATDFKAWLNKGLEDFNK